MEYSDTYRPSQKNQGHDEKEPEVKPQQTDESGLAAEKPPAFNTTERKSDTMESTNSCEVEPNHEPTSLDAAHSRREVVMTSGSGVHLERPLDKKANKNVGVRLSSL